MLSNHLSGTLRDWRILQLSYCRGNLNTPIRKYAWRGAEAASIFSTSAGIPILFPNSNIQAPYRPGPLDSLCATTIIHRSLQISFLSNRTLDTSHWLTAIMSFPIILYYCVPKPTAYFIFSLFYLLHIYYNIKYYQISSFFYFILVTCCLLSNK